MMKNYHLYVFSQEECPPCIRLKDHIKTLTEDEQAELDFVPFKVKRENQPYAEGVRTALADEHDIVATPTLLVVHQEHDCASDEDGDEWCDFKEVVVERYEGANNIIEHLSATLDAYTYSHPE